MQFARSRSTTRSPGSAFVHVGRRTFLSSCAAVATILFAPHASQAGIIAGSTFGTNLDGWTSNTPSQISWSKTGGNPGGFVLFEDETGDWTVLDAPAKFLGSYSALNTVGTISFDHKIISETDIASFSPYEVDLSGPGGSATWTGATPTGLTGWVTVNVPLVQSDWHLNSGTWAGLLANVAQLQIPIELVTNQSSPGDVDHEGIDNVALSSSAPEPASLTLIGSGIAALGGWTLRRCGRPCAGRVS
jgi:hypothetical protein